MQGNRNIQIDGLRGIAILAVVIYHIFCRYKQIYMDCTVEWMECFGASAVNLFFLMSGFFLGNKTNFLKKILRLWPSYIVGIIFSVALLTLFPLPNKELSFIQVLTNAAFLNGFVKIPYVDGAHWYIHTLIILFFWGTVVKNRNFAFCLGWLFLVFLSESLSVNAMSHLLGGKYAGCFICGLSLRKFLDAYDKKWFIVLTLSVLEIFLYQKYLLSFVFVGSALLFVLCVKKRLNFLESRIFAFFGLISYPLYIIHQNLVYVIEYYLSPMIGFYCAAIISFFVSIVAGMVLFYLVERKSQEFLGRTKNA